MIWDRGTWEPEHDPHKGLAQGPSRLRTRRREAARRLAPGAHAPAARRKARQLAADQADGRRRARAQSDKDILEEKPLSVATGRTMDEIASRSKKVWHSKSQRRRAQPDKPEKKAAASAKRAAPRTDRRKRARASPHDRCAKPANRLTTRASGGAPKGALPAFRRAVPRDAGRQGAATAATGSTRSSSTATASRRGSTDGKVKLLTRKGLDWTTKFPTVAEARRQSCRHGRR